jgi:hypothetical protein
MLVQIHHLSVTMVVLFVTTMLFATLTNFAMH